MGMSWGVTKSENNTIQYCFPDNNRSCSRSVRPDAEYILVYIFVGAASVLTVFLNLLVIISIAHFKQLHTPTNVLILSLAAADLIAGLVVMPVQGMKLIEPCWYFGEIFCSIFPLILYVVVTASLGNMIIISVDRYIAVNDPLLYPLKVNNNRVIISVLVNWLFSFLYNFYLLYEFLLHPETNHTCIGECVLVVTLENIIVDAIVCLAAPCCIIIYLYVKIVFIANYQTLALDKKARSERKAARTLGIVVLVYLLCWMPYYLTTLSVGHNENNALIINIMYWIVCMNSCMNPLIYAMFYRWFRLSTKYILTLKIFQASSEYLNLFPEEK